MRKIVERLLGVLTIISFTGVILTVMIQIMSRYLPYTAIWTEELTRYLFIYAISFGAPLALIRSEFISVDFLLNKLSHTIRSYYEISIYLSIFLLSSVMVINGYKFTLIGNNQMSATMPVQMSFIHSAILILSIFLAIFSIVKIVDLVCNRHSYIQNFGGEN